MSSNRKPALILILVTLFLDSMGFGLIIPIVPDLLIELTGLTNNENAIYGGALMAVYAVMQLVCGPIVGGLSDRYGRRPILLAALFGFAIDYVFTALANSIWWLFLGRMIAGIMGASFTTGGAYISDISTPETRAQNFGMIGAAFGLGFIAGPALGGLLGQMGTRAPFYAAAGLALINWLYAFFVLPESLKPENRRPFDWSRANPIGTFRSLFKYKVVAGLFAALALVVVSAHAVQSNWNFFTKEQLHWTSKEIGISLTIVGVLFAVVQGGLIRVIIPKLGQTRSVYIGLAVYALGLVLYAFAVNTWMMYAITAVYVMGGIASPAIQGIMAGMVPPNAQGELQGGFTSLMSAASIVGPLLMNSLFAYFSGPNAPVYFPGAAMMLGAVLCLIASLIARSTLKKHPPQVQPPAGQAAEAASAV